ncbi:DUF3164 family protein [Thalassolituus sp. UBA3500]|uniref:DUF3164 family protein n=1 Tax=Thalassolituus sp. UBA3500 TaxID=1947664 RepID=UPI000C10CFE5|nr:DUF3164 family protein [Thalassolituus sp. UBA3500]MBN57820.1 sulfate transporter [Oceanospirillaceae bacterium]|tara:strand:+ start:5691 stop:6332 length:642 start_codon:yes stop_codon:yes gene_type:complete
MNTETIPEGYMQNNRGDLVREENVKDIDKIVDQSVTTLAQQARDLSMSLTKFKRLALDDIRELITIAGEKYGENLGGDKGNITLCSYDGRYKIQRTFADRISFNIEMKAAESLFDKYLEAISASAAADIRVLINATFRSTRGKKLRTAELLRLLSLDIKHPDWIKACEALKNSIMVDGATVYIRLYERVNDSESYRMIPLNITDVGGGYVRNN